MKSDYFEDEYDDGEDEYFGPGHIFDYKMFKPSYKRAVPPSVYNRKNGDKKYMYDVSNKLYSSVVHVNDSENFAKILLDDYREKLPAQIENAVQVTLFIHPNKTLFDFIDVIKKNIEEPNATVNFSQPDLVQVYTDKIYFSINLVNGGNVNADVFSPNKEFGMDVLMFGNVQQVKKVYKNLRKKYILNHPVVTWLFRDSDGSINGADFDLKNPSPVYQEYYPYVPDMKDFGRQFMESSANVLVLYGVPGSGKTSFIRNMLIELNEGCLSTFDDAIMQSDKLYIRFLNNYHKFLVLEDADTVLLDREKDDNKVMSKILSASDGLVSVSSKKMIFTTNLTDISKIDSALIREGRCFGVINFRELNRDEAERACAKMGKELPDDGQRTYSLAKLFNPANGSKVERVRMGFGR